MNYKLKYVHLHQIAPPLGGRWKEVNFDDTEGEGDAIGRHARLGGTGAHAEEPEQYLLSDFKDW